MLRIVCGSVTTLLESVQHITGPCGLEVFVCMLQCVCVRLRGDLFGDLTCNSLLLSEAWKCLEKEHKSRALDGHGEMCNGFLRSSEAIHFSMSDPSITHPWSMQGKYKISIMAITPSPKSPLPVIYPQRNNAGTYLLWLEKAGFNAFVPCGCVVVWASCAWHMECVIRIWRKLGDAIINWRTLSEYLTHSPCPERSGPQGIIARLSLCCKEALCLVAAAKAKVSRGGNSGAKCCYNYSSQQWDLQE